MPAFTWQRSYRERVVRNQAEYDASERYIVYNPRTWAEDDDNPTLRRPAVPEALGTDRQQHREVRAACATYTHFLLPLPDLRHPHPLPRRFGDPFRLRRR